MRQNLTKIKCFFIASLVQREGDRREAMVEGLCGSTLRNDLFWRSVMSDSLLFPHKNGAVALDFKAVSVAFTCNKGIYGSEVKRLFAT